MDADTIVLNAAYVIYVASSFFGNLFRLRIVLIMSSVGFAMYGIMTETWSMVGWNVLFGVGSAVQLGRIISRRRSVQLDVEATAIHQRSFSDLDVLEFFTFWSLGHERTTVPGEIVVTEGKEVHTLSIVMDGEAQVEVAGSPLANLAPGDLVGEMSFLRGGTATADVRTLQPCRLREWDQGHLAALDQLCPAAAVSLKALISQDLARKVAQGNRSTSASD